MPKHSSGLITSVKIHTYTLYSLLCTWFVYLSLLKLQDQAMSLDIPQFGN